MQIPMPPRQLPPVQKPNQAPQPGEEMTYDVWVKNNTDYKPTIMKSNEPQYLTYDRPVPVKPELNAEKMKVRTDKVVSEATQRMMELQKEKQQRALGIFQALNMSNKSRNKIRKMG
jgi:hypothetical protein